MLQGQAGTVGYTAKPGTDRGPGRTQTLLDVPLSMARDSSLPQLLTRTSHWLDPADSQLVKNCGKRSSSLPLAGRPETGEWWTPKQTTWLQTTFLTGHTGDVLGDQSCSLSV